jgi:hypothetical protein
VSKRIYRIGRKRPVLSQYLRISDTVEKWACEDRDRRINLGLLDHSKVSYIIWYTQKMGSCNDNGLKGLENERVS